MNSKEAKSFYWYSKTSKKLPPSEAWMLPPTCTELCRGTCAEPVEVHPTGLRHTMVTELSRGVPPPPTVALTGHPHPCGQAVPMLTLPGSQVQVANCDLINLMFKIRTVPYGCAVFPLLREYI